MLTNLLSLALLASPALSVPLHHLSPRCGGKPCPPGNGGGGGDTSTCASSVLYPEFPTGSTNLSIPDGVRTVAVVVGFGEQVYSCSSVGGTPVNTANAVLYDITEPLLNAPDPAVARYQVVSHAYIFQEPYALYNITADDLVGSHSYVPYTGGSTSPPSSTPPLSSTAPPSSTPPACPAPSQPSSLSSPASSSPSSPTSSSTVQLPHFELTRTTCPNEGARRTTVRRVAFTASPLSPPGANIVWAELEPVDPPAAGDSEGFVKVVFRTDTQGGTQPRPCTTANQVDSVPYAAIYWFMR
ncbi:hypothetical protein JCM8547_004773 [Rhodosporidiobolus lusitaniae]